MLRHERPNPFQGFTPVYLTGGLSHAQNNSDFYALNLRAMKRSISFTPFVLLVGILILASCKQEATTTEETSDSHDTMSLVSSGTSAQTQSSGNPALAENMSWTFLTHQLLHNRATVVSGNVGENPKAGHWMDFHENGTYEYGIWSEKTVEGTWSYDNETKLLQLKPASGSQSEWRVMHKEDNVVLIGTTTHGNNTNQEQWVRKAQRPSKNTQPAQPN